MKKPNKILHKLLCPGTGVVLLSVPVAAGLLVYTFLAAGEDNPIAYLAYMVSAYSLTVVCVNGLPLLKKVIAWGKNIPYVRRYREDLPFRLRLSLYFSLVINLLYAGVNAVSGLFYHSPWFGSLGAYYTILSAMRCLLVRYARKNGFGEDKQAEWKRYRLCGVMLMVMNIALAGVVVLVLRQNRSFQYAGFLIYVMAGYTFYITVMAVVNVFRYQKYHSPVMSAARVINLTAALVSMLSLETAMLSQFGGEEGFRRIMLAATGGTVSAFVVGMGISMIVRSTIRLRKEAGSGK